VRHFPIPNRGKRRVQLRQRGARTASGADEETDAGCPSGDADGIQDDSTDCVQLPRHTLQSVPWRRRDVWRVERRMEKKAVPQHRSPGRFAMDVAFPIRIVPPRLAWLALDWSLGTVGS
jgi:hypothetical protein